MEIQIHAQLYSGHSLYSWDMGALEEVSGRGAQAPQKFQYSLNPKSPKNPEKNICYGHYKLKSPNILAAIYAYEIIGSPKYRNIPTILKLGL